jgi:hypothetical protein
MKFPTDIGRDCARAWEAMPWVLQNSAPQEQDEWLTKHLAHCESCRVEFAQQSRLQLALSLPTDVIVDADAGLRRLLGRLDTSETPTAYARPRSTNWMTRALVAAVLLQALGIGALGVKLWPDRTSSPYRTLSQESSFAAPGAIHVVPDATMTLADWNGLLRTMQLQVVGGPNDVGAYIVAPASSTATTQDTLKKLRAARGIRLAEPIAATP